MDINDSEKIVTRVLDAISTSGSYAVNEYVTWFIVSAIVNILAGIIICYFSFKTNPYDEHGDAKLEGFAPALKWVCFFVGILFITLNIPDLAAPKAASIHQLIKDVKSS